MFLPKSIDAQLDSVKARTFGQPWLNEPDAEGHFPTNGDRWAAQEVTKRQDVEGFTRRGFILQAIAANWHHKSAAQLKCLGDQVGRNRILVIHGTVDRMITVPHGDLLVKELGGEEKGVRRCVVEGKGHGLPMEWRRDLTKLIAGFVEDVGKRFSRDCLTCPTGNVFTYSGNVKTHMQMMRRKLARTEILVLGVVTS